MGGHFICSEDEQRLNNESSCARCLKFRTSCLTLFFTHHQANRKMVKTRIAFVALSVLGLLFSCMEVEKPVTLASSLLDKKITMTSSSVEGVNVVIYLITEDPAEGELLAKAMNFEGKEIGRAKQILTLGKDESKLVTFTFGAELELEQVVKYVIDFRKQ